MFHLFHKPLLDLAKTIKNYLIKRAYDNALTYSEILCSELSHLDIIREHDTFKRVIKEYGGLWPEFDESESKFNELLVQAIDFHKVVGQVDHTHDYNLLMPALNKLIEKLSWFEDNEQKLLEACGNAMGDITDELKEIEHVKDILDSKK